MSSITHDVDPDGDLIVVLKEPNTKNVIPEVLVRCNPKRIKKVLFLRDTTNVTTPCMPSGLPNNADLAQESDEIRFRVSSKHLKLASVTFKAMFNPLWIESEAIGDQSDFTDAGTKDSSLFVSEAEETSFTGSPVTYFIHPSPSSSSASRNPPKKEVTAIGWNAHALLTVFNVIHGKCSSVPRKVSLEFFAHFALIADYYNCAEALSIIADFWFQTAYKRPEKYGKEVIMWLTISSVFSWSNLFHGAARMIVERGEGLRRVTTHDLPIAEILEKLDGKRKAAILELTNLLRIVESELKNGKRGCNATCRYVMIGLLVAEKHSNSDYSFHSSLDDKATSLSKVIAAIKDFTPAEWYDSSGCAHPCNVMEFILPTVAKIEGELGDLKLSDFKPKA